MKSNNLNRQTSDTLQTKKAPENKDNLDSRKKEEQEFKGSDVR